MTNQPTERLVLFSTCGTSILTYKKSDDERKWLNSIANETEKDLSNEQKQKLAGIVKQAQSKLAEADVAEQRKLSAELNGIHAVLEKWKPQIVEHRLLHTDTYIGRQAMELVRSKLEKEKRGDACPMTTPGLRTDSQLGFRGAISKLTKELLPELKGWKEKDYTIIFNLTGGFKSLNAYIQALGSFYADRCVFLFEAKTSELMEIPRLPARLDIGDSVTKHERVFRKREHQYPVDATEAQGVPETLVDIIDNKAILSPWGDVAWAEHQGKVYGGDLLDPLSDKLDLSKKSLRKEFAKLPDKRKIETNQALDALSAYLDDHRPQLKSNTFKKLQGKPNPPSTHELYLWSDGDAGRLYGHYEDGIFIADSIGEHL
jgi:putative CRISPR-associated protein (TIGR02619 family)